MICANRKTASRRSLRNPIRCFGSGCDSSRRPLPSPPAEQAAASEDQAGQAGAEDWAGDGRDISDEEGRGGEGISARCAAAASRFRALIGGSEMGCFELPAISNEAD